MSARTLSDDSLRLLEQEIRSAQEELGQVESRIRALQSHIHARYHVQIERIQELSSLHKEQKLQKREKRREQKKRGKNYREPTGLKKTPGVAGVPSAPALLNLAERKKLYREAIVQVHPDKFANETGEKSRRSQELTLALIDIYQSGDLAKLRHIHRYIMSGNAVSHCGGAEDNELADPDALRLYLTAQRDDLRAALAEARQSRMYEVLATYADPLTFIDELSVQFTLRIQQLERRTRKR